MSWVIGSRSSACNLMIRSERLSGFMLGILSSPVEVEVVTDLTQNVAVLDNHLSHGWRN